MTKIQILGSGCDKCRKLAANVKLAAERIDLPCEIEKIEDINQITAFGVMMTPALVVNGKVVSSGKVLTADEIAGFLTAPACDCGGQCASSEAQATDSPCCCGTPAEAAAPCCCGDGGAEKGSTSCCCGDGGAEKESASCCCGGGDGTKKIMTIVLLIFIAASIVFMAVKRLADPFASSASPVETEQADFPGTK